MSTLTNDHHMVAVSNPDDKLSNIMSAQDIVRDFDGDKELEPIVTWKELWSYYRMSPRLFPFI